MQINSTMQRLLHNWPYKVACFILAVFLALFHRVSTREEKFFSVPLEVITNDLFVPVNAVPRFIKVHIRGDANKLYPVLDTDIHAYIDLSQNKFEERVRIPVSVKLDGAAIDVEPLEIMVEPADVSVDLEKKSYKTVPVVPAFRGYPEKGYEFSGYVITPPNVEISGPHSIIDSIENVGTDVIDISGRNDSFSDVVLLSESNSFVHVSGTGKIDFSVRIQESMLVRMFDHLPVEVKYLDSDFVIYADNLFCSLQLKAPQRILENFVPNSDIVYISCVDIDKPGVYVLPVNTRIPSFATLQKQSLTEVVLTVDHRAKTESQPNVHAMPGSSVHTDSKTAVREQPGSAE